MPRHKSTHIGICISDGSPASSGPLQDLHTFKMTSSMPSPYRSHASHHGGQHVDGAPHPGCGSSSQGSRRGQRALFKMAAGTPSLYFSQASHHGGQHVDGAPHPGCGSSSRGSRRGQRALFKWRLECRR